MTRAKCVSRWFAALSLALLLAAPVSAEDGWVSIFDGKTLNGWSMAAHGKAEYKVVDGTIHGKTVEGSPNSFLKSDKVYGDFELEFEVRVHDKLNSGCQIRSKLKGDKFGGRVYGPQVEIEKSPGQSGFIYGEQAGGWQSPEPKSQDKAVNTHSHFKNDGWKGYLEDRRPNSQGDPYQICSRVLKTISEVPTS